MKTTTGILWWVSVCASVVAGPIKDMVTNDPGQIVPFLAAASYADRLGFINRAYAECKAENNDIVVQYVYMGAIATTPVEMQLALVNDFLLVKDDLALKSVGAEMVKNAFLDGRLNDTTQRQQMAAKLKAALAGNPKNNRDSDNFARAASEVLIFFGDDAGLDMRLTDSTGVHTLQTSDHWNATSDASVFAALVTVNQNIGPTTAGLMNAAKVHAAFYELCRLRRVAGKEVKPLNPLVNLDELEPH